MSEHTHLSGIQVDEKGAIHFTFATHEDKDKPAGIHRLSVPEVHNPHQVADQLQMLAALGAMRQEHAHAVASHLPGVAALYTPGNGKEEPKPTPAAHQTLAADSAQQQVHGVHTGHYLQQQAAATHPASPSL